jgi:hypothetical protein
MINKMLGFVGFCSWIANSVLAVDPKKQRAKQRAESIKDFMATPKPKEGV